MSCAKWEVWIHRELDGDLSPPEKEVLERHLSSCSSCRNAAEHLRSLSRMLSELPRMEPTISLTDQVLQEIEASTESTASSSGIRIGWFRGWSWTGVIAVCLVIVWFAVGSEKTSNPPLNHSAGSPAPPSQTLSSFQMEKSNLPNGIFSEKGIPSPDGRYIAQVRDQCVIIRDQKGHIQFQSPPWETKSEVRLHWKDHDTLSIRFKNTNTERKIHIPSRKEHKEPTS
ncbi:anti-sigma factor family protein [Melghirimyces algeriensis]|uniref:Anti-sigma-W factor RsiW n=1 Tax=Melghirimyces algeriensis TaxID=910412 RepID=A0A521BUC6_9BACL|nr:zf-HC2 domain-containing protein [Melghirimyces algeriensis]SMO50767.1 Putative zinc-finger [Melghirimyces algeriensis]